MKIEYYIKEHFGVGRMYIANPEHERAFKALTKRKIVLPEHIAALKILGIELVEVEK